MTGHLFLITNNEIKFKNSQNALKKYGIEVEQVKMDVPEIQSSDVTQIAEFSAKYAGDLINTTTIKIDVSFEIRALNGFPGPFVKYVNQWLSPDKIIRLMENEKDRYAQFIDCVSLYDPERHESVNFISITSGCISDRVRGNNGWGMDKIFIPDGKPETLACYSDEEKKGIWNQAHWQQLGVHLQKLNEYYSLKT